MQTPYETVDVKMRRGTVEKTLLFGWGGGQRCDRWWHIVHITKSVVINKNERQMDLTGITQVTTGSAEHFCVSCGDLGPQIRKVCRLQALGFGLVFFFFQFNR